MRSSFLVLLALCSCSTRPPSLLGKSAAHATLPDAVVRPLSSSAGAEIAVVQAGGAEVALVADRESRALDVVDLRAMSVTRTVPLGAAPGQLAVARDGTIYTALRGSGEVVALRLRADLSVREVARHATGDEPYGLALDGDTLWVTSIVDARLEGFRASALAPTRSVGVAKDPRSVVVLGDGRVVVSHATGSALSVVPPGQDARTVSLTTREKRRDFGFALVTKPMAPSPDEVRDRKKLVEPPRVTFAMKRDATQGFGLTTIGDDVFVPEALVLTSDGSSAVSSGYGAAESSTLSTHVPYVARVHVAEGKEELANQDFSGPVDRACFEGTPSCIVPRGVASDGTNVYIACTDANVVAIHDPGADYEHAPACARSRGYQRRVAFDAPTAVTVAHLAGGDAIVAWSEIARRVGVASVASADAPMATVPVAPQVELTADVLRGRALFHRSGDERISGNGRACASCHVDGREDGLVWPTPKGKRQTPMLAGRLAGTEPYDWNGAHATLAIHIESTLKNLGGKGLPREDLDALAAYVRTIEPPHKRARDSVEVRRGGEIFRSDRAKCASCHDDATRYTDGAAHAIGLEKFDTPTLAFVGQTAPYFHDGRYATLDQLVEHCDGVMGTTSHLSSEDKKALVAFLRSL